MKRLWAAAAFLCLAGCAGPGPATRPAAVPGYAELVRKFNRNLAPLDELSATAQIEVIYHDDKGKRHYEQADDSRLMLVRPDRMALSIRKFGLGDLFWAGSDATQYWLFELADPDNRKLYRGRHDGLGETGREKELPVPVQPRDLPRLLGIVPIEPEDPSPAPKVRLGDGGCVIEPPGGRWRLTLDPQTARPVRIELLDKAGRATVESTLSQPEPVELAGKPPGAWPNVMSRVRIIRVAPPGSMSAANQSDQIIMHLSGMSNTKGGGPIPRNVFDLDRLIGIFKPKTVIDLDAPSPAR